MIYRSHRRNRSPRLALSRRSLLLSSSVLLSSCGLFRHLEKGILPVKSLGDSHVHLFNAADLPVEGFFAEVLAFQQLRDWPEFVLAFVKVIAVAMKSMTLSAAEETAQLNSLAGVRQDASEWEFAAAVLAQADKVAAEEGAAIAHGPRHSASASANALFQAFGSGPRPPGMPLSSRAGRLQIHREIARAARLGAEAAPSQFDGRGGGLRQLWQLVRWAYLMTNSRSSHVERYLREMRLGSQQASLMINLLVDYDHWLNDTPKQGSGTRDQIDFWTTYSSHHPSPARIVTFAGYDPLAHAISTLPMQPSTYFNDRMDWLGVSAGSRTALPKITGLKLYPPMGFSVVKNGSWLGKLTRSQLNATTEWLQKGGKAGDLPVAMDRCLDEMIRFCTKHDVPVLAHAGATNEAYEGAGQLALPEQWLKRLAASPRARAASPLRLLLAHYDALNADFRTMRALLDLNRQGRANVFFDVAYDEQILAEPSYAGKILGAIGEICADHPEDADYFTFGTDWIMLPQQVHYRKYARIFADAVSQSPFWNCRRDKFFGGNLRRFLKIA